MKKHKLREELVPHGPGRAYFDDITKRFDFEDPHHWRLLVEACKCLDEEAKTRKEIAESGEFFTDRFGARKPHAGFQLIKDCRIMFARLTRELQLDALPPPESRPPTLY